jgi:hypothetical protein
LAPLGQRTAPLLAPNFDVGGGPYYYLRCTCYPHPDGFTTAGTIWGSSPPDDSQKRFLNPRCGASFGIDSLEGGSPLLRKYGIDVRV